MKKLLLLGLLLGSVNTVYAGCQSGVCSNGDYIYLEQGLYLPSLTIAQINATVANGGQGMMVMCSDCTRSTVCVSSGTGRGAFVIAVASGTFAGASYAGIQHCQ